jgi:UDP-glucose 4-epimerase
MKIMVTGAAGFIGFHLARELAWQGHHVVCVDNFVRGEDDAFYRGLTARANVDRFDVDLADQAAVRELPEDVETIYHMAALNGTQNFYERPFEVVRCCTLPTIFLLEKYGSSPRLRCFVYAGTSEAYASTVNRFGWEVPTGEDVPLSIDDPFNPRWSYGASKMHGEIAVIQAATAFGTRFSIIRYHNVYGPRMGDKHIVPDFLHRAREGVFALYGYEDTRSFLYIDDAVAATLAVGTAAACEGQIVNIGGTRELTMLDLARTMMDVCGFTGEIALNPAPRGSVKRRAPKIDKLRALTGFAEAWDLADGLRETARFYLRGELAPRWRPEGTMSAG